METNANPGGWTSFRPLTSEDKDVFNKALNGLVGVGYEPLLVATQVVAGINYRFFCNAKVVYPNAPYYAAIILIFKPLQGDAHITSIQRVD